MALTLPAHWFGLPHEHGLDLANLRRQTRESPLSVRLSLAKPNVQAHYGLDSFSLVVTVGPVNSLFRPRPDKEIFMNLTISGHHLEVTPALRGYVTSKLDRITRHFDQVVDVKVLLTIDNMKEKELRQRAECNIHVKGRDIFAESSHADLYAAIDELADKLDRQVVRYKTRVQDHHHETHRRQTDSTALDG